jgi:hypothetical protein
MSAAPPPAERRPPVPLYTRHMLGAIEAARDRRLQERNRAVPRYTSADPLLRPVPAGPELDRRDDEGGSLPSDTIPATLVAGAARAA